MSRQPQPDKTSPELEPLLAQVGDMKASPASSQEEMAAAKRFPQCIAHRGYTSEHPENSMEGFVGAVELGIHALETDLHISKDGVLVLSHDPSLKRCFGEDKLIADCDWSYLQTLRTIREPHVAMPTLVDLLEYLGAPEREHIWLLLDIKVHDDPEDMMHLISTTLPKVSPSRPWKERIRLGVWVMDYIPLCEKYLPGYEQTFIGFDLNYALKFLPFPGLSFNIFQYALLTPFGWYFLRKIQKAQRPIFLWTVNHEHWMVWSIRRGVTGVITDDPKRYLEVCRKYERGDPISPAPVRERAYWVGFSSVYWFSSLVVSPFFVLALRLTGAGKIMRKHAEKRAQTQISPL